MVEIDPGDPVAAVVFVSSCGSGVHDATVTINGWDVPHYDESNDPHYADRIAAYLLINPPVGLDTDLELEVTSPVGSRTMHAAVP